MNQKKTFALAAFATMLMSSAAWAETELTVYTAIEAEDLKRYAETFNQDHPDIKLNFIRDSTGVITAKLRRTIRRPTWSGASPPPRFWFSSPRACWKPTRPREPTS
jgi:hypothetical protein